MTYEQFIDKARNLTIYYSEDDQTYYLHPEYKYMLYINKMYVSKIDDYPDVTMEDIYETLNLEVIRLNKHVDKINPIYNALYEYFVKSIEPEVQEKNTEIFKLFVDYLKNKNALADKEKELNTKEEALNEKESIKYITPGINFAKKKS